jgi:hypothetical protein
VAAEGSSETGGLQRDRRVDGGGGLLVSLPELARIRLTVSGDTRSRLAASRPEIVRSDTTSNAADFR